MNKTQYPRQDYQGTSNHMRQYSIGLCFVVATLTASLSHAQSSRSTASLKKLPDAPIVMDSTARSPSGAPIPGPQFRVSAIKGLVRPYAMAFLPDGRILISERAGRIRVVANGKVDAQSLSGVPAVFSTGYRGMNDLALHPQYSKNHYIYFTYYKPHPTDQTLAQAVLARGRYDGSHGLADVKELFVADRWVAGPSAAKIQFANDGTLFLALGFAGAAGTTPGIANQNDAQDTTSVYGKILRLKDDGSIPKDNPFVGKAGYRGEIYALGIRNAMGMALHPQTGQLWETENGPQGGDELNIIQAGKNYGWPIISYGRAYSGESNGASGPDTSLVAKDGLEQPLLQWSPSPGLAALTFYTGEKFPEWKNNVFVAALVGEQIQRIAFNDKGLPVRRQALMTDLGQRIRDIKEGPDGLLYALTDEDDGALLRIEPVK